jgi:hypothetical protein
MFRYRRSKLALLLTLGFLFTPILAQTTTQTTQINTTTTSGQKVPNYVVRYFDVSELNLAPGEITLSPDYQTIIEFEDLQVEMASSGRADQITVEISGSVILLRANQNVVNTDLTVMVGGKMAMFMLNTDPARQKVRRYVIFNK